MPQKLNNMLNRVSRLFPKRPAPSSPSAGPDLTGQVVLITGGSRGLGLLTAREFGLQGCRVAICARDDKELEQAATDLANYAKEVLTVRCDLTDQAQVAEMMARVTARYGQIDILVNNAALIQVGPVNTMGVEDFRQAMDIIFWGTLYPTLAVLPAMRRRRAGRIVHINSIGGKIAVPHLLPYSSAKFAMAGLSEGLRSELKKDGVTVTTIYPGLMRTGSFVNVPYKGDQKAEYTWFSLGDNLPFISMDAERAARQVVEATRRGAAQRTLSLPANLAALFHGVFPGLTTDLYGLVNRFGLPAAGDQQSGRLTGTEIRRNFKRPWLDTLTGWGLDAARRFNQQPDRIKKDLATPQPES